MWPFTSGSAGVKELVAGLAPDAVIDRLLDGRPDSLVPAKRPATVFFCDVDRIAAAVESLGPENLAGFLTAFHGGIDERIRRHGGIVDNVIGVGVMALWNAPEDCPAHPAAACLAALDCQTFAAEFGAQIGIPDLRVRVGISSGFVVAGLFAFGTRRRYTAFGDVVTIASSLEGVNRFFGTRILAGEETYRLAGGEVVGRALGRVRLPRQEKPVQVFEVRGRKEGLAKPWAEALPLFAGAVESYGARRFGEALAGFRQVLTRLPDDVPARLYASAAEDFAQVPPPDGWDGVFNITSR